MIIRQIRAFEWPLFKLIEASLSKPLPQHFIGIQPQIKNEIKQWHFPVCFGLHLGNWLLVNPNRNLSLFLIVHLFISLYIPVICLNSNYCIFPVLMKLQTTKILIDAKRELLKRGIITPPAILNFERPEGKGSGSWGKWTGETSGTRRLKSEGGRKKELKALQRK